MPGASEEVFCQERREVERSGRLVVFTDLDGVLNTKPDPRLILLEPALCQRMRRLLDASGATVVLTTPWRRHHGYIAHAMANFGVLREEGSSMPAELERTPRLADAKRKDLEILHWLRSRPAGDVRSWVALDTADLLRFPSADRLRGHTIRVRPDMGLSDNDVQEALRLLGCADAGEVEAHASADAAAGGSDECGSSCAMQSLTAMDEALTAKMGDLLKAVGPELRGFSAGGGTLLQQAEIHTTAAAASTLDANSQRVVQSRAEYDEISSSMRTLFG